MESQGMMAYMQAAAAVFGSVMVIVALFMLWTKQRSNWLLLALGGEVASLVFRGLFSLLSSILGGSGSATFFLLWQATYLMVGAGLLGYALESTGRRT